MNNIIYSFFITSIAGFSTLLGMIPCFINKKYQNKIISFTLSFSAGIMLTISLLSLIPEGIDLYINIFNTFPLFLIALILIIIGILLSFFSSHIIEKRIDNSNLYKLGIISLIVLILHNIPEGITTFISSSMNKTLGLKIAIGIALHNIPEGIAIAIPIFYSTKNIKKAFIYTLVAGFSELFGGIIAYILFRNYITNILLGIILLITAGIMIHISIYELLPNSLEYKKKKTSILAFIIGIITFIICEILLT